MARKMNHHSITSTTSDSDSDSSTNSIPADLSSHHNHNHRSLPSNLPPTLSAAHHQTVVAPPPPSRPSDPKCWHWRCHKCKSRYPMGATQRCLLCSHKVCRTPRPLDANPRPTAAKRNECRAFFDYTGWKNWAKWRRDLVAHNETQPRRPPTSNLSLPAFTAINANRSKAAKVSHKKTYQTERVNAARRFRKERTRLVVQMNAQRLERMRTGLHDCVTDCDWPSECRYEQVLALEEETEYWEEHEEADEDEQNEEEEEEEEEEEDDQKDGDDEENDIPETSQWDLDFPSPEEAYPEHLLTDAESTAPDSQDPNLIAYPCNFQIINDDSPPAERDSEESHIPIDPALEDWLPVTLCPKQPRTPLPDSPRSPEPSDEDEDFGETQGNVTKESHGDVHGEEEAALIRMHREFMAGSLT